MTCEYFWQAPDPKKDREEIFLIKAQSFRLNPATNPFPQQVTAKAASHRDGKALEEEVVARSLELNTCTETRHTRMDAD